MSLLDRRVAGEVKPPYEIKERTFEFGVMIVEYVDRLPRSLAGRTVADQLIRSGTAVGAMVEEADGAESNRDFVHKMSVALKEARESHYWLRVIKRAKVRDSKDTDYLIGEAMELIKILSTITKKAKRQNSRIQQ